MSPCNDRRSCWSCNIKIGLKGLPGRFKERSKFVVDISRPILFTSQVIQTSEFRNSMIKIRITNISEYESHFQIATERSVSKMKDPGFKVWNTDSDYFSSLFWDLNTYEKKFLVGR